MTDTYFYLNANSFTLTTKRLSKNDEDRMTWLNLVRKYFPDATDDEADYILWEETAFPFAPVAHIEKQLAEYRFYSGSYFDWSGDE